MATAFGLIKLTGKEQIFSIDGQHRVEGIKAAISDDNHPELEEEEQTVIIVAHKTDTAGRQRTRRLFTTLNRYAVRVSQGELIALSEDDTYAIVARKLIDEYPGLSSDFVPLYPTANLPPTDKQSITSLISLYSVVKILAVSKGTRSPRHFLHGPPNEKEVGDLYQLQVNFWDALKLYFPEIREISRSKPESKKAGKYRLESGGHFLLRPFFLVIFAKSVRLLMDRDYSVKSAIKILSKAQMEISNDPWKHVIWNSLKNAIIPKNEVLVRNLLLHQVDQVLDPPEYDLKEEYKIAIGESKSSYLARL